MIICNQCGNPLTQGLRFCTECGTPVSGLKDPETLPTIPFSPPVVPPISVVQTVQPERKTNLLLWTTIPFILLIFVSFAIYQSSKSGPASNNLADSSVAKANENSGDRAPDVNSNRNSSSSRASNMNMAVTNSSNMNAQPSNSNINATSQNWTRAYCNANSLMVRSAPVLDLTKGNVKGELTRGEEVWIIRESTNYDTYNGVTSNWAEIQVVQRPLRGWAFKYYLASMAEGD